MLLATGILGATVMPHVIYLHSSLTQNRIVARTPELKRRIFRYELLDILIAMGIAGLVNAAMLMMAVFLGHIYMGTIGMRGAYKAMRTGYVDEAWAKEHHAYWYEDVKAGKIPAQRSQPLNIADPAADTARPA